MVLKDILSIGDQEGEFGNADSTGFSQIHRWFWSNHPVCSSSSQKISCSFHASSDSSDEICANAFNSDSCVVISGLRQIAYHVLLPLLFLNIQHKAGRNGRRIPFSMYSTTGNNLGVWPCCSKSRMSLSSQRHIWHITASDGGKDLSA